MIGLAGLREEMEGLRKAGLWRTLRRFESLPGPRVVVDGREYILCASNNYLGLAEDPRLREAAVEAVRRFGTGSTGSRLITGNTVLHEALEERIARWKGAEAAMVLATGYMANVAIASTLAGRGDVIFSDELNHASIIDGCRMSRAEVRVYRHADPRDLERRLAEARGARRRIIITDGVFSMDGDVAPLPDLLAVARRYEAAVVVDDAHGGGVLGERGRGTAEYFGIETEPEGGPLLLHMGTLSKAAGVEGAYIAGPRPVIAYLQNRARPFIFSTAPSPATVGAALRAIDLIEEEPWRRRRLEDLARRLRAELRRQGWNVPEGPTPIIPVIVGDVEETLAVARRLDEEGVFAPAIRPPTVPAGSCRIRVTVTAAHSDEDIARIAAAFERCRAEKGGRPGAGMVGDGHRYGCG
ncbi:MAG: 8-amino-7-oxononanoate synthase [Alicyclobacillaceae bacterium]|nr:8-amino-7-oxononanoate synthase [Alicyclobacillaceae bacterium]